jgi:hypothetical protein
MPGSQRLYFKRYSNLSREFKPNQGRSALIIASPTDDKRSEFYVCVDVVAMHLSPGSRERRSFSCLDHFVVVPLVVGDSPSDMPTEIAVLPSVRCCLRRVVLRAG